VVARPAIKAHAVRVEINFGIVMASRTPSGFTGGVDVTPDADTVEVLAAYAKAHDVDYQRWRLLTGAREEIYDLGRKYYFVEEDLGTTKASGDFLHTENFVLLDKHRQLRGIYNSLDPSSMKSLVADIGVLKRER
jgi:protein SCO1